MPPKRKPLAERFIAKVDRRNDGCWIWTGCEKDGYGLIGVWKGQRFSNAQAHRVSWELVFGEIPAGMHIDHMCHVPACVNPAHLRPVTPGENQQNRRGAQTNSTTGFRGVSKRSDTGTYRATVQFRGRQYNAGNSFSTAERAAKAAADLRNFLMTHNDSDRAGHGLPSR